MRFPFNSRQLLKLKLPGSTLVETIVASVILMIVFGMAMDTLTRILISNHKDNDNLMIESAFSQCQREIVKTEITAGNETYTFDWGKIETIIAPYGNGLFKIEMNAITNENKKVSYRYIAANENTKG